VRSAAAVHSGHSVIHDEEKIPQDSVDGIGKSDIVLE
jgi:hypothetical protein